MKTLIIFDNTGRIYYMASGDVIEPRGLPFLWVEVPDGKYIAGVDVSGDEAVAILEDEPKTETQFLNERIAELEDALCELSMTLE